MVTVLQQTGLTHRKKSSASSVKTTKVNNDDGSVSIPGTPDIAVTTVPASIEIKEETAVANGGDAYNVVTSPLSMNGPQITQGSNDKLRETKSILKQSRYANLFKKPPSEFEDSQMTIKQNSYVPKLNDLKQQSPPNTSNDLEFNQFINQLGKVDLNKDNQKT